MMYKLAIGQAKTKNPRAHNREFILLFRDTKFFYTLEKPTSRVINTIPHSILLKYSCINFYCLIKITIFISAQIK